MGLERRRNDQLHVLTRWIRPTADAARDAARRRAQPMIEPRLAQHLPDERITQGREVLLEPVRAGKKVVEPRPAGRVMRDGQRMADDAGAQAALAVVEAALIGIDDAAAAEIVEIANRAIAARDL